MTDGAYNFPPEQYHADLIKNENVGAAKPAAESSVGQLYCIAKESGGTCEKNWDGTQGNCYSAVGGKCLNAVSPEKITEKGGGWSWLKKIPTHMCVLQKMIKQNKEVPIAVHIIIKTSVKTKLIVNGKNIYQKKNCLKVTVIGGDVV